MAMTITLLGVGEAFDAAQANSSALVRADGFALLIDCGHSVVSPLWRACPGPDEIDAVYLTHHHGDHVLGLLPVLDRWGYDGRRKPLAVVTTEAGIKELQALFLAGRVPMGPRSPFPLELRTPDGRIGPFAVGTAPTQHGAPNHAIRLELGRTRLAYSGDGRPTEASRALFADVDLLMHECWSPEATDNPSHCDLATLRGLTGPSRIGLYHVRAGSRAALSAATANDDRFFVPEAGTVLEV